MKTKNFDFKRIEGLWYFIAALDLKSQAIKMPVNTEKGRYARCPFLSHHLKHLQLLGETSYTVLSLP